MEPPAENNFVAVVHGAEDGERLGDKSNARSLCSSLLIDQVLLAIDGGGMPVTDPYYAERDKASA
jgi:hypothetical protein